MEKVILNRVLAVLLCIAVFANSFVISVFAVPLAGIVSFFETIYGFICSVQELDDANILDKTVNSLTPDGIKARSLVLSQFSSFKSVLPSDLSEDDFLELLLWFCTSDNGILIEEKYGHDLAVFYNAHWGEFLDFEVNYIVPLFNGLEDFVHALYNQDLLDYKTTDEGDVVIPVENFVQEITKYPHLYKNLIKVSFRDELSKNPNVNSQSFVKLYTDGVSCVGTNMNDGVYLLRYVYRDGKYYFSPYQYYFHREINVSSGVGSGAVAGSGLSSYEWFTDPISMIGSDSFKMSCCTGYAQSTINLGYTLYNIGSSIFCNDFITFSDENGSQLVGTPMDSSNDYYENHPDVWSDDFYESYTHLIDESGNRCGFEHSVSNYRYIHGSGEMCPLVMQYSYWHLGGNDDVSSTASSHALTDLSAHDSKCTSNCDFGYYVSSFPLSLVGLSNVPAGSVTNNTNVTLDPTKLPSGYNVVINNDNSSEMGDTIYNYTIVNPETGQKDTIRNFVTNNYTFTTINNGDGDKDDNNSGGMNGNITVGGKVEVGGRVDVGVDVNVSVPDININVNSGDGGSVSLPDIDIVENLPEAPQNFIDYLKMLFDFIPGQVLALIIAAVACAFFCRIWGR